MGKAAANGEESASWELNADALRLCGFARPCLKLAGPIWMWRPGLWEAFDCSPVAAPTSVRRV